MRGDRQNSCSRSRGFSSVRLARGPRAGKEGAALPAATEKMLAQPRTEKQVLSFDLLPAAKARLFAPGVAQPRRGYFLTNKGTSHSGEHRCPDANTANHPRHGQGTAKVFAGFRCSLLDAPSEHQEGQSCAATLCFPSSPRLAAA